MTQLAFIIMTDSKPRIIATGGAVYIVSHALLRLRDLEYYVVIMDSILTGCTAIVPKDVKFII